MYQYLKVDVYILKRLDKTEGAIKNGQSALNETKHTHKTKDRVTRTPLKTGVNSGALEEKVVLAPPETTVVLI